MFFKTPVLYINGLPDDVVCNIDVVDNVVCMLMIFFTLSVIIHLTLKATISVGYFNLTLNWKTVWKALGKVLSLLMLENTACLIQLNQLT